MNATSTLAPGLPDGVHDSQQAFRAVLDALARPGQVRHIGPALPGVALGGAMARLLLSLSDDETPVWWPDSDAELPQWLRFHTGAPIAARPDAASFAVVTDLAQLPALANFTPGSAASPELSCTLLIELPALVGGPTLEWHGPGIASVQRVGLPGLPDDFWAQWQANHAAFPQGVDLVFTCGEEALGLPRTTRVRRLEGV
ncbi:MAG: PhnH protein [Comamonadaceae bacterium]|nr:MAG: PhnH protein [Comamonadaceae bacterium]